MKKIFLLLIAVLGIVLVVLYSKKEVVAPLQVEQHTVACSGIEIISPIASSAVFFPLSVSGTIHPIAHPGTWIVFEGEAGSVVVLDSNGNAVSDPAILSLEGEWMNTDPKPLSVVIPALTSIPSDPSITLHFTDNDPSGEGNYHTCDIPVLLN